MSGRADSRVGKTSGLPQPFAPLEYFRNRSNQLAVQFRVIVSRLGATFGVEWPGGCKVLPKYRNVPCLIPGWKAGQMLLTRRTVC